ncbi:MAG: ABC transporter ATP-binding protein [Planctomycetota bacterium]
MPETDDHVLLDVRDIRAYFHLGESVVKAVDGVSFSVDRGETLAIVGESGCGKSVTGLTIMRLIPAPPGVIESGRILLDGTDLLGLPEPKMRNVRGREIAMIFQEPMTSLNPVFTIGNQIVEAIQVHRDVPDRKARDRTIDLLRRVQIPDPEGRFDSYPHQLSGGLRQRAMIAMALACNSKLLIADEPTTALDVTIQAQILELIQRLRDETGMAVILITHDLGVVANTADRVVVMYAGRLVEQSPVEPLFDAPLHPYTRGLLKSIPSRNVGQKKLPVIPGVVPDPANKPPACHFHPRCPYVRDVCKARDPELREITDGRLARCWALGDWLEV